MVRFLTISILFLLLSVGAVQEGSIHHFTFITIGNEMKSLSDYMDKVIVIEWVASWCPTCKKNLDMLQTLYLTYEPYVTFLAISFYGSGDDLSKVADLQEEKDYPFVFGLDEGYASTSGARNSHTWILDRNRTLIHVWGYGVRNAVEFENSLIGAIQAENSSISLNPTATNSDLLADLWTNPLFWGFWTILGLGVIFSLVIKQRSRSF